VAQKLVSYDGQREFCPVFDLFEVMLRDDCPLATASSRAGSADLYRCVPICVRRDGHMGLRLFGPDA